MLATSPARTRSGAPRSRSRSRAITNAAHSRKILVVEDEPLVAMGVASVIEDMGHEVCGIAASVDEALELNQALRPDLVTMDVNLQAGGNGIDAAERLRGFEHPPVVVFLTSYIDAETRRRMEATAPFAIIQKPFDETELQRTVQRALGR